jgi:hypothetical protein
VAIAGSATNFNSSPTAASEASTIYINAPEASTVVSPERIYRMRGEKLQINLRYRY